MMWKTCSCYQQLTQTPPEHSLAKYWAEQVPVRHAERHFLNIYVDGEYAKMTSSKGGRNKSSAIVTFPGN